MDHLSAKGRDFLDRAKRLKPLIESAADEIERRRDLSPELFAALREQDMFRLVQPAEYGGVELDPPSLVQVIEEIARHDASTAWCIGQTNICALTAAYLAPDVVREIFGTGTGVLAWGPGPGQASVVPGGYRVSGQFDFASGSRLATWLGAHVPVIERDGSRRMGPDGKPVTTTMLFPKSAVEVRDTWHTMGLRGTGSDSYVVKDVFVPEAYALERSARVRPRAKGRLYVFTPSTLYASCFAGIALGIARTVMSAFIKDAAGTIPRGGSRKRAENNVIQSHVGLGEARLRAVRTYLIQSIGSIWEGVQERDQLSLDDLVTIRMASTLAIQTAREVVATLYAAAGALAIFNSRPFERRFRDIHTVSQQIQGHAEHFETVGQVLLGVPLERPLFTF